MKARNFMAVAAAVFGFAGAAAAQNDAVDLTPSNVSVRAGVGLALDNNFANYGNPLIALGAEINLDKPLVRHVGPSYFSVDYLSPDLRGSECVIPICINQRFYFKTDEGGRRTYGFLGIGGAIVSFSSSSGAVCVRGGVGADLGENIYFEVAGLLTDTVGGVSGDSAAFYVGYRF